MFERAREQADMELGVSKQRVHELAQHLQTTIEMERAAIAREIHDDVGGSLTALKFDLAWIERHSDSEEIAQRARSALEVVTHAIEASKRIMHNLHPAILEQGLVAALQWMASRFEKRTGVACTFRTSHESMQLPAGVPLVAYRTAQEELRRSSTAQPDCGARQLERAAALCGEPPERALLVPLHIKGRLIAILYGDYGRERPAELDIALFRRLAQKACLALEIVILRNKISVI